MIQSKNKINKYTAAKSKNEYIDELQEENIEDNNTLRFPTKMKAFHFISDMIMEDIP